MEELTRYYCELLQLGFIVMRQAIDSEDMDWLSVELEMLHNIPSLIGEANLKRHCYYWTKERRNYLDWVSRPGHEFAHSRSKTYYVPIWEEMRPIIENIVESLKYT
jgi:hypothetical protein